MKKLAIILAGVLVTMISCTKSKEVHPEIGDGNDEIVTVGMKDVHVEYTRTDHAELNHVVFHYCPADANGNAQQFVAAEMTKKETFFDLVLDDLICDTLYWYYYELFPNSGDAFTTAQKTFHTQACDAPGPPEPPTPPSGTPEGAINGLFTINEHGDQVYFSQGNLQYQASTNTWRFADHQWDYVGEDNNNISQTNNGWIDLFGWGTSSYNHGAICYQPWSTSSENEDYYVYGDYQYNLFDQTGKADWGYNPISNGGNVENSGWRTLNVEEMEYLINTRITVSGIRFSKAVVNNINGVILLPDDWSISYYSLNETNNDSTPFTSNVIDVSEWFALEQRGAVFLPAAGDRVGNLCEGVGGVGYYWLASHGWEYYAGKFGFFENPFFLSCGSTYRSVGHSVRLIKSIP